jgi:hypothetical protein
MSIKKVTTEMINARFNGFEKTTKDLVEVLIRKLTGMENENAELKGKLVEIQSQLTERETERNVRKPNRSSDSDEDHQKRKKSSESSSSDKESNKTVIEKVCAQEVLAKISEPEILIKTAEKNRRKLVLN